MGDWLHISLGLVPMLPLAGFLALAIIPGLPRRAVAAIGVGSVAASALFAAVLAAGFLRAAPPPAPLTLTVGQWFAVAGFTPRLGFYLDALSLVMIVVVSGVGFLIHLYSAAFMITQGTPPGDGYRRFFACMNLFVASMLILVLADDLLLLYLGWEGVGLCSYLLIGFWYRDPANGHAALKAFVVTRVGDTALAIGLFLLFSHLGTLQIQEVTARAASQWVPGSAIAVAVAALLLGGAVGKSAQLPLQTWLPDAMAGPTPVSALIHAATMVTAGVYLIARTHVLFELAPPVQALVAIIGAVTLLLAGCSALVQKDIKRVLAYSTMSQVGYMFLALGVGAWSAAVFHLVTHAFFKSLLFLAAGVIIAALGEEHNLFKMGGLRRTMPAVFWTFLIGAFALAALPPTTAGLSKELILSHAWTNASGGTWLFAAGLAGVFITSLYTFRMLFLAFFGTPHAKPTGRFGPVIVVPLLLLAAACLFGGLLDLPRAWGGQSLFTRFLDGTFRPGTDHEAIPPEEFLAAVSLMASLMGAGTAALFYWRRRDLAQRVASFPISIALHRLWLEGWGFDTAYRRLLVVPLASLARRNQHDAVDRIFAGIARYNQQMHRVLSLTQTGLVRAYMAGIALGAILIILMVAYL